MEGVEKKRNVRIKVKKKKPHTLRAENRYYIICQKHYGVVLSLKIVMGPKLNAMYNPPRQSRFDTPAGNPVKKILLKLNLFDYVQGRTHGYEGIFKDGDGADKVLKLKIIQGNDALLKLFKIIKSRKIASPNPVALSHS
ncbi:hypothetical protein Tco_1302920 [Tanacetum coccineum]